ncbi:hypothetical protein DFH09DRAFT_1328827 [Mycena vulgaris]|nr:hypothetical protein DFH09DRAFT_1328827 [Mycena vulgaris]
MTSFTAAAPGTVPVPETANSRTDGPTVGAMQAMLRAALASLDAAPQPTALSTDQDTPGDLIQEEVPAAPMLATPPIAATVVPAPTGFLTQGPWVVGSLYVVVPTGPLLPINTGLSDEQAVWYCITRGHYVGITLSNLLALAAVVGVSASNMKGYHGQALAIAAFNEMLQYRMVAVIP